MADKIGSSQDGLGGEGDQKGHRDGIDADHEDSTRDGIDADLEDSTFIAKEGDEGCNQKDIKEIQQTLKEIQQTLKEQEANKGGQQQFRWSELFSKLIMMVGGGLALYFTAKKVGEKVDQVRFEAGRKFDEGLHSWRSAGCPSPIAVNLNFSLFSKGEGSGAGFSLFSKGEGSGAGAGSYKGAGDESEFLVLKGEKGKEKL